MTVPYVTSKAGNAKYPTLDVCVTLYTGLAVKYPGLLSPSSICA